MVVRGKIFHVVVVNQAVVQVVMKKKIFGKLQPSAYTAVGRWKDVVVRDLKIIKGDVIQADCVIKSRLWNNKWYSEALIYNIVKVEKKVNPGKSTKQIDIPQLSIVDEKTGEVLL